MIRRLYDPKNIPKLIAFGKKWHAKLPTMQFPFSEAKCEALLKASFMSGERAVWGSFDGNKVTGVLVGCIEPFPFMEGSYVSDIVFCAERDGDRLLRVLFQWGKSHGAVAAQMGVTSGIPQAEAFYEAFGLRRVGGVFMKALAETHSEKPSASSPEGCSSYFRLDEQRLDDCQDSGRTP